MIGSAMTEKYAVAECERRFLLSEIPSAVSNPRVISDLYLAGTRLRVRLVAAQDGEVLERKLGHKRRLDAADPTFVWHSSLYLDESEYEILSSLPGRALTKTRWSIDVGDRLGAVDAFEGALAGLLMLEVELGDDQDFQGFQPPEWVGEEVTYDERFTGGALAGLTSAELNAALGSSHEGPG
jgi:CYTH domain-containing protein